MANVSQIRGLVPLHSGGNMPRMNIHGPYYVKASEDVNIGEVLVMDAADDGYVSHPAKSSGDQIVGVAASYVGASDSDRQVDVWDDPEQEFEIQCSGAATIANVGQFADVTVASGATFDAGYAPKRANLIGFSQDYVTLGDIGDTKAQLQIVGKGNRPGNDWGSAYVKLRVRIAEHMYATAASLT